MGLKTWLGRHEPAAITLFTLLILALNAAFIGYHALGSHYDTIAVSYEDRGDELLIHETLTVNAAPWSDDKVLYRSFAEQVCEDCNIRVRDVQCDRGQPYVAQRRAAPLDPQTGERLDASSAFTSRVEADEIGCYSATGYAGAKETITASYAVPQRHVGFNHRTHVLFSTSHWRIDELVVDATSGQDAASSIAADARVEVHVDTGAIAADTASSLPLYLLALLFVIAPAIVWRFWSRENEYTVPQALHAVPNPEREGWMVDVLVNGGDEMTEDGLGSVILSLYVKGAASVSKKEGVFSKTITAAIAKDAPSLTGKERQVLEFLKDEKTGEDDEHEYYECTPSRRRRRLKNVFRKGGVKEFSKQVINTAPATALGVGGYVLAVASYGLFSGMVGLLCLINGFAYTFGVGVFPKSVFGRFKDDHYKEFLEWVSFKQMLSDYANIQKYFKEDHRMWQDWLVYGAALGAAENVLKAMEELDILSAAKVDDLRRVHTGAVYFAAASHSASSSGSGAGGGGGFGGGGGGGR